MVALGAAAVAIPALAGGSAASTPSFTAVDFEFKANGAAGSHTVTIAPGGTVEFSYPSGSSMHNVDFGSTPPSSCTQTAGSSSGSVPPLPNKPTAPGWSGTCTFANAGTYTFKCDLHSYMTGTITVGTPTPTATTENATGITETGATLNGTVNPEGQETHYYFKYGTSGKTPEMLAGSGNTGVAVSAAVTGLTPHTEYHFRLVAVYGAAKTTVEGPELTFTTATAPGTPTATTEKATGATQTEATLNGSVNPEGQATSYYFNYGTTTAYGSKTEEHSAGSARAAQAVHAPLTGLSAGTVYYYELVAVYDGGKMAQGGGLSLMTLARTTTTTTTTSSTTSTSQPPPPTSTTTTTSTTPVGEEGESPPAGALQLASSQRGGVVRGSVNVSKSGAGGRLQVELLASSASLAKAKKHKHAASVRVGSLMRTGLRAGKVSFSVALSSKAKSALRRHHRLAVTVKVTVTPTHGKAFATSRSVVVHG